MFNLKKEQEEYERRKAILEKIKEKYGKSQEEFSEFMKKFYESVKRDNDENKHKD